MKKFYRVKIKYQGVWQEWGTYPTREEAEQRAKAQTYSAEWVIDDSDAHPNLPDDALAGPHECLTEN